ncbi:hypothetical protein FNFX1_0974 [Francisella cf. novicida Fx1]|nr:hypothetical protein [Francisella tularensis]AEE87360.1 hypothetical protein FNFX1_0974 [Francisella cf. novicida Fx1]AJI72566.1 hypothetical protein AQ14_1743 [Francisella tularensis subsp. novicida D9876]MBK2111101.1 hypothetical protein [Francisella tularensis subsp. novicida FSC159]
MKESAAFDQEKKAWFAPLLCTVERGRFEVGGKLFGPVETLYNSTGPS